MLSEMAYHHAGYVVKHRGAVSRRAHDKYVSTSPVALQRSTVKMGSFMSRVRAAVQKTGERLAAKGDWQEGDRA